MPVKKSAKTGTGKTSTPKGAKSQAGKVARAEKQAARLTLARAKASRRGSRKAETSRDASMRGKASESRTRQTASKSRSTKIADATRAAMSASAAPKSATTSAADVKKAAMAAPKSSSKSKAAALLTADKKLADKKPADKKAAPTNKTAPPGVGSKSVAAATASKKPVTKAAAKVVSGEARVSSRDPAASKAKTQRDPIVVAAKAAAPVAIAPDRIQTKASAVRPNRTEAGTGVSPTPSTPADATPVSSQKGRPIAQAPVHTGSDAAAPPEEQPKPVPAPTASVSATREKSEAIPVTQKKINAAAPLTASAPSIDADTSASASAAAQARPPVKPAEAKPVVKPGVHRTGFKTGEFIVYPAHGVGRIVAIESQEVAGYKLELFVISFIKDKMTLKVPMPKVMAGAIRKLADADVVKKSLDTLMGRARVKRTMWSRRAQEYEAKINSGDLVAIAEVVRDLYRSEAQPEQSYSERQLYEAALDRMAREIAAVQKLTETESLKLIESQLQKGPRRPGKGEVAAEGEAEADGEAEGEIEEAA